MIQDYLESESELRRRVEKRLEERKGFLIHIAIYAAVVVGLGVLSFMLGSGFFLVATAFGWGAGVVAHAIDTYFKAGAPSIRMEQSIWREMRATYGDDWRETASRADYNEMRGRLMKPYNKRKEFLIHLSVYAMINVLIWYLVGFPVALLASGGWGLGLVAHGVDTFVAHGRSGALEREVERERERLENALQKEKRKRAVDRLQLTSDGELLELIEEEPETASKVKRR